MPIPPLPLLQVINLQWAMLTTMPNQPNVHPYAHVNAYGWRLLLSCECLRSSSMQTVKFSGKAH